MNEFDLIIIGAGTSGLPTSRVAANNGKKVLLLGEGPIGGKCVNWGCTPTKALVYCTHLYKETLKASKFGVKTGKVELSFSEAMDYTRKLVKNSLEQNEKRLASFEKIEYIPKNAKFINDSEIEVDGETFSAPALLIATGARNFIPPINGLENVQYLTNKNMWSLKELPKSIGFIGGGFISCEFASIFNIFGSEVSIFERNDRVIIRADELISKSLNQYFNEDGIKIYKNTQTSNVRSKNNKIIVKTNRGEEIELDQLMVATGFKSNADKLNINVSNVDLDHRGYVVVNEFLETTNPKVWAIGDIVGKQQFTHMALRESKAVLNNIFNNKKVKVKFEDIPYAAFTEPPIGSVGRTESQLKDAGIPYKIAQTELPHCSRGLIMQLNRGHVKLLHNEKEIFACHIIGEYADNLVHEIVPLIGVHNGWDLFKEIIHAHPTLAEIFSNLQK